jgi:hypothetical protein
MLKLCLEIQKYILLIIFLYHMRDLEFFFNNQDLVPLGQSINPIACPFDLSPSDYVKFAETDLKENSTKGFVNSLANIKRSIDSQIEILLLVFGVLKISKDNRWSFPKKIKFLKDVGLVAPRILNRIIRKRNCIEHDFFKPKKEDVEDSLDVCILFLHYTNRFYEKFVSNVHLETRNDFERPFVAPREDVSCEINWDPFKSNFNITLEFPDKNSKSYDVSPSDKNFVRMAKCYLLAISLI